MLRRNWKSEDGAPATLLEALNIDGRRCLRAEDLSALLGFEGAAAARYFGAFSNLLKPPAGETALAFDFRTRNRRPPTDPVNALLSYAYALLAALGPSRYQASASIRTSASTISPATAAPPYRWT